MRQLMSLKAFIDRSKEIVIEEQRFKRLQEIDLQPCFLRTIYMII
ncbi:hypothetical protein Desor_0816 [Desulfosporosinus orientis DSM 765]|uniref:Uncharacterized protein n=1 Tax=Desulfosporosinus orientis (strain ATCC 19365 / DSM 765 / NCIMB 8382 / VKM B-1628 / Singapore I) TaxID=768706 RepID=G7WAE9_DESOD|nr:hypothetical protein Desor_0816 [Desulfosporosinus orientis DSM 765]